MIMRNLREKMMDDMGANVMVNVVHPTIVTIHGCKTTPQIIPFLSNYIDK